jgi:multimeric flavodoxin WrbA
METDVLFIATPIYFNDVSGIVRCFLERFWFPTVTYTKAGTLLYPKRIKVGMIFTANSPTSIYENFYASLVSLSAYLIGRTEYVAAEDTWQFDDYSKYAADSFDAEAKKRHYEEVFPGECRRAYEMGRRLVSVE